MSFIGKNKAKSSDGKSSKKSFSPTFAANSEKTKPQYNTLGSGSNVLYNHWGEPAFFQPNGGVQLKLKTGKANDKYEKEANTIADKVLYNATLKRPETTNTTGSSIQKKEDQESDIQAKPVGESITPIVQKTEVETEQEHGTNEAEVQRKSTESGAGDPVNIEDRLHSSKGGGSKMDDSTQSEMESSFGQDFSNVNIHTGSNAVQMSEDIGAKAFAHGNDIYFNRNMYNPNSKDGKHLLAHELTHTVQQGRGNLSVQRDLLNPPTTPDRKGKDLTPVQIEKAIAYNQKRHTDFEEIALIRDILGLSPEPKIIDADFIQFLAEFQTEFGLTIDGKMGKATADQIAREIIAAANLVGSGDLENLKPEFVLKTTIRALIDARKVNYAEYKTAIRGATMVQKFIVLHDKTLLKDLKALLPWNNFAKCIELLGYAAPTYRKLIKNSAVKSTIRSAWNDSDVASPIAGVTTQHEEGGWVYLNLISGVIETRRAPRGAGAAINLSAPPLLGSSVVVGKFHTHPNLGGGWNPAPSPADIRVDALHGVPDIVVGSPDLDVATYQFYLSGPSKRKHLAGNKGLPGAAGGISPQGKFDGTYDKQ